MCLSNAKQVIVPELLEVIESASHVAPSRFADLICEAVEDASESKTTAMMYQFVIKIFRMLASV